MQNRNTFPKKEHLFGEATVETLYKEGASMFLYPYKLTFLKVGNEDVAVRCLVYAPKKRFKHAVDRNRLKRQIREVYRTNKHSLFTFMNEQESHLHIAIHYVGDKLESYAFMQKRMIQLLNKLEKRLKEEKI
jgi:ribonuclease P protein component